jgi:molybdenum cofactor biosynthesis protein A
VTDEGRTPDLALTTNALGLAKRARGLKDAGLNRVNISLDSLDREHYAAITRRDRLDDVLEGIEAAARAGLTPIKVNTLVLRGMNEADLPDLVDYCLDRGIELRVIEQMPIGPPDTWDRQNILTADEILHIMGTRHTLTPAQREDPHSPAGRWIVDGDPTKMLGVIASVSEPFCGACDRTRLTSDGMVRSCLFSTEETSLRDLLRGGGDDAQIAARWADAMWAKPAAHGLNIDAFARPSRTMSRIGG